MSAGKALRKLIRHYSSTPLLQCVFHSATRSIEHLASSVAERLSEKGR